ncbi:MAG: hypothetical protein H7328_12725 [Bdellovibrio sp.]|nr:hypothetical protein [Bdellovibrio sp.]
MKKLLVLAVALASVNAFATKARISALANSPHLIDTQTVFSNPADMFYVGGDYVTLESGQGNAGPVAGTPATTTPGTGSAAVGSRNGLNNAEGMVVRSFGDAKAGFAIGHQSALATGLRGDAAVPGLATNYFPNAIAFLQQNPIDLSYGMKAGDLAWAGTLVYSKAENKVAGGTNLSEKEDTLGLRGGFRMGAMDAKIGLGLANNYSNDADGKFTGTMGVNAGFGMWLDTTYLSATIQNSGYKVESNAGLETRKYTITNYGVNAVSTVKKDGSEFFYGVGLTNSETKVNAGAAIGSAATVETTTTTLSLPVTMGLEVDAASWMTFRGSITQAIPVLNSTKTSATTTSKELNPITNNTAFAAGVGLKFNKISLDGTILTGGSQVYSSNALLSQVGLTYMF